MRDRLYRTALALFEQRGFESTSVAEICERADVAKGTFFNYFPSKEHVLSAYHDELKSELLLALARRKFLGAESAVKWFFSAWARRAAARRELGRLLVRVFYSSELLLAADAEMDERLAVWLRGRMDLGIKSGELRPDLDVDRFIALLAATLSATTIEAMLVRPAMAFEQELKERCALLFVAARAEAFERVDAPASAVRRKRA